MSTVYNVSFYLEILQNKAFELFLPAIEKHLRMDSCCSCIRLIPCLLYAFKKDDDSSLCRSHEDRVIQLLLDSIRNNPTGLTAADSDKYVNCIVDSICALLYSSTVHLDSCSTPRRMLTHVYSLSQWTSKQRAILNRIIEFIYLSLSSNTDLAIKSISTKLFVHLSLRLRENIIVCYQKWFSTALYGLGDADAGIRRYSIEVFRMIVPMAPIAKQRSHQICREVVTSTDSSKAGEGDCCRDDILVDSPVEDEGDSTLSLVLLNLFSKETSVRIDQSKNTVDMKIISTLHQLTNLVDSSPSHQRSISTTKQLSSAKLRDYQWSGVSWLTQLRRFGLNGILADAMYASYIYMYIDVR